MSIREEIVTALATNDVQIFFTKADGKVRVLNATSKVPEDKLPKGESTPLKETHIRVFDKDISEWRTVVVDRITSYEVLN